jgi:hypothetical protein
MLERGKRFEGIRVKGQGRIADHQPRRIPLEPSAIRAIRHRSQLGGNHFTIRQGRRATRKAATPPKTIGLLPR